jgi:UV DNA damage endonuclease
MNRFGYACINTHLREKGVFNSRTMRKKTFLEKGLPYVSEVCLKNTKDIIPILHWNYKNNIKVFRLSSELMPWASEYMLKDLPDYDKISHYLNLTGMFIKKFDMRVSFHPGQFNCLASEKDYVVENCIKDLEIHGKVFDLMSLDQNHNSKINIHLGSTCGGQLKVAANNFIKNFSRLSESVQSRLTVENDDKAAMFSSKFLYENIYKKTNLPIVFDSHHFTLGPQDADYKESFMMAYESWPKNIRPTCHHSNGKKEWEDDTIRSKAAHSNYYYTPFDSCGKSVDVILESKMKEKALLKYRKDFLEGK